MPTVLFLSVHKGASTFLSDVLGPSMLVVFPGLRHLALHAEILRGRTLESLPIPAEGAVVSRIYPAHYEQLVEDPAPVAGKFADKRLVMVRRDPRDVAVSLYYSWANTHLPPKTDASRQAFFRRRKELRALAVEEAILRWTARPAISEFAATERFLSLFPSTCLMSYEQLVEDFPAWLSRLAYFLDWPPRVTRALLSLEDEVRPPSKARPLSHKRLMAPGSWREHFDSRLRRRFTDELGERLAAAGYSW